MKVFTKTNTYFGKYDTLRVLDVNDKYFAYYILRYYNNNDKLNSIDSTQLQHSKAYRTWLTKVKNNPAKYMKHLSIFDKNGKVIESSDDVSDVDDKINDKKIVKILFDGTNHWFHQFYFAN